jgi:hypothetical protein
LQTSLDRRASPAGEGALRAVLSPLQHTLKVDEKEQGKGDFPADFTIDPDSSGVWNV